MADYVLFPCPKFTMKPFNFLENTLTICPLLEIASELSPTGSIPNSSIPACRPKHSPQSQLCSCRRGRFQSTVLWRIAVCAYHFRLMASHNKFCNPLSMGIMPHCLTSLPRRVKLDLMTIRNYGIPQCCSEPFPYSVSVFQREIFLNPKIKRRGARKLLHEDVHHISTGHPHRLILQLPRPW